MPDKQDLIEFFEYLFLIDPEGAWEMLGGRQKVLKMLTQETLDKAVLTSGKAGLFDDWYQNRCVSQIALKSV